MAFFILACAPAARAAEKFLDIQEVKSPGGLTAWLVEDHSLPLISLEFAFHGAGSALDPADKQGLARMVSNTMDEGADDLDAQAARANRLEAANREVGERLARVDNRLRFGKALLGVGAILRVEVAGTSS